MTPLSPIPKINLLPIINAIQTLDRAILNARIQRCNLEAQVKIAINTTDGHKYEKIDILC